jgi:uncharacterized protein DUF6069
MTTNISAATFSTGPRRDARRGLGSLLKTAAVAAVAAAVAGEIFRAIAVSAGVPMQAGLPGEATMVQLTFGSYAIMTLMCVVPGTLVAGALALLARRPARTFVVVAVAVTAASLLAPIAGLAPATSTRVVLSIAHVLAAAVFVPPVARRLTQMR